MDITATLAPESPILFQPVFREGCEEHLEFFKEMFNKHFSKDYRDNLLKRSDEKDDLSFRVLKKGEESIGIIVYVKEPSTSYRVLGWNYAFDVKVLHLKSRFNRAVWKALILKAEKIPAISILIHIPQLNDLLKTDLLAHEFKRVEYGPNKFVDIFGYVVQPTEIQQKIILKPKKWQKEKNPPSKDLKDNRSEKKSKVDEDQ